MKQDLIEWRKVQGCDPGTPESHMRDRIRDLRNYQCHIELFPEMINKDLNVPNLLMTIRLQIIDLECQILRVENARQQKNAELVLGA